MTYEIGQKVETEKGNGIIVGISGYEEQLYIVEITNIGKWGFNEHQLKPYRTAHEKLLEMGYECEERRDVKIYRHENKISSVRVYDDNTISCNDIDLELSRILTQYLEEMAE